MNAHLEDLRAEVRNDTYVAAVAADWRTAPLAPRERALCAFAWKLTRTPGAMAAADAAELRAAGCTDEEIHDAAQVAAYFNYINRIADALGVDPEEFMPAAPR